MQINPYSSPRIKVNYKWIEDLNVRPDILNLIENKSGNSLELMSQEKAF